MHTNALIVGGGIAGLTCAWELAQQGLTSLIVEAAPLPGGHVARFCCKATDRCQRCGACMLEDLLNRVESSDRIETLLRTTVSQVDETESGFGVELSQRPLRISLDKCTGCAECLTVCPVPGALVRSPSGRRVDLVEEECLFFKDASCRACADACPEAAVNLPDPTETLHRRADAVILAAGFQPFNPLRRPHLGYGRVPGVITAAELDSSLRWDGPLSGVTQTRPRSVAFIQCVGSRDARRGKNYCSRVCCGYALRLARVLQSRFPGLEVSLFYMDIQSFERDFDRRLQEAGREVRLIRSMPGEIRTAADGRPELIYQAADENRVVESHDLVVLSVGISASKSSSKMSELFGVQLNEDGFLGPGGEEVATVRRGVFVAGTVQGPRSIAETVSHSIRTAAEAGRYVRNLTKGDSH